MNKALADIVESDALHFVPLGGSEEFGANLNLYICNGSCLAVDCGIAFADERFPGIDLLLPDPWFLEEHKERLKGIVITHAHEDHVGALPYLWERLQCPIYTTRFTASVLRRKFEQEGVSFSDTDIRVIPFDTHMDIDVFSLTFVPVSHSVPDSASVFLKTPYGPVLHSGDWNLDPAPVVGTKTQEKAFREIGKQGVLAYVGDSTNAQVDGYSGSEADVEAGLLAAFQTCQGKIAVTTFSSNIGRMISIARAAHKAGRSVALIGRSLKRMAACAYECGLLDDIPDFLDEGEIKHVPDENLLLIVTGSQGERRAALSKIAQGEHRTVSLNRGDTVIFSARAIPGNERHINALKNTLTAGHVRIITPQDADGVIHVSGHPCREEIAQMLQWVRPGCVVPVHGERIQLDAQAALARECQVKQAVVPANGAVIRLAPGDAEIVDHIETRFLAVDLARIIPATHQSITARRKLQYSGTVHASVVLNAHCDILGEIKISTVGLSCERSDDSIIDELIDCTQVVIDSLRGSSFDEMEKEISEKIRIALRRYVSDTLRLKPKTTVHVTYLDI